MSTNKRHSRGGMKPLRQRSRARNKAQRIDARDCAAWDQALEDGAGDLSATSAAWFENGRRVDAWKRRHQQRHAENLAAAALGRYKAVAEEQAARLTTETQALSFDPPDIISVPMNLRDRKGGDMDEWPEALRVRQFPLTDGELRELGAAFMEDVRTAGPGECPRLREIMEDDQP
jgi:hypothetical protein